MVSRLAGRTADEAENGEMLELNVMVRMTDETGVISIFRNSVTTKEEGSSRKSKRRSRAVSSEYAR